METGGVDHHVQVTGSGVVSSQSAEQLAHRALLHVNWHSQKVQSDDD